MRGVRGVDALLKRIRQNKMMKAEMMEAHIEYHRRIDALHGRDREFRWYNRHIRYTRPVIMVMNLLFWYLICRYFGLRTISVIFASVITIAGIAEMSFLVRLEKRIFDPLGRLRLGVEEIAKGNYDVEVGMDGSYVVGVLIGSFNGMAKKLLESEQLKSTYERDRKALVANISHDLKTPITTIRGYVETMMERPDLPSGKVESYLRIIHTNAEHMNRLIDDLFLFSKLDMQKLELDLQPAKVSSFMGDMMEEFKYELEDKGIGFTYEDTMPEDHSFRIDGKRISQVLRNIIGNAVKYGDQSDLAINCRLRLDSGHACIDIRDNGPGISRDKLPLIFERFYRVDDARTTETASTGLGLAISKELVEAHGGYIMVDSGVGAGTCFTVMLPLEVDTHEKDTYHRG